MNTEERLRPPELLAMSKDILAITSVLWKIFIERPLVPIKLLVQT